MEGKPVLSPELQAIEKQYERDVRIVEAEPLLRRIGIVGAFFLETIVGVFSLIVVVGYIIQGSFTELRAAGVTFGANLDTFRAIASASDAKELELGAARVLQGTPTSYDFYATVRNVNEDWFATFTYTFSSGSINTEAQEGFVMPGEQAYVLALGVDAASRPGTPKISVENIVWHRVDRHVAPDTAIWLERHHGFVISEPTYTTDIAFGTTNIGRTTFTVTNATPYAYWTPQFTVILERAGAIVGISQATLTEFDSGEARDVEVRWYGELPVTATARVLPAINYFDTDRYMPPRGTPLEDIRDTLAE